MNKEKGRGIKMQKVVNEDADDDDEEGEKWF